MADSFTANHVQGIFGEFKPVFDYATNDPTSDNTQGIFGLFSAVLDEAGAAVAATLGQVAATLQRHFHLGW